MEGMGKGGLQKRGRKPKSETESQRDDKREEGQDKITTQGTVQYITVRLDDWFNKRGISTANPDLVTPAINDFHILYGTPVSVTEVRGLKYYTFEVK